MKTLEQFLKELMLLRLAETNLYDPVELYYIKNTNNNLEKIIYTINECLKNIHTEYTLLQRSALLEVSPVHTVYKLRPEFATTSSSIEPHKYIKDSIYNPFYGNVLKILSVTDEDNVRLPMNMFNDLSSVFILEPDVIQFGMLNGSDTVEYFDVCYQANHIPFTNSNYTTQFLTLADSLHEMFSHYVSYKILSSYQTKGHAAEVQKHYAIYTQLKTMLENTGTLYSVEQGMNNTFDYKGFV
jgi:hypothetical protein